MSSNELRMDLDPTSLTPVQQQFVDAANADPVDYSVDNVIAAARANTGLDDTGPEGFEERLQKWIDVAYEDNRTNLARMSMFGLSTKFLSNRMRVYDFVKRHPEVREIEIKAPVVVMGLPRSGTSHLVNLLAADSRFRAAPIWELSQVVPAQGQGPGPDGVDPRYKAAAEAHLMGNLVNPYLQAWHPMDPWRIEEDIELLAADFSGYYPEHLYQHAEQWRDYYLAHDQTPHYEFWKLCLQIMQWHRPRDRWVTKYPAHIENIPALLSVLPDAICVETHRDPVEAVVSAGTMSTFMGKLWQHEVDPQFTLHYWRDVNKRLIDAGMRDRHLIEGQVADIPYEEFVADNWTAVRRIYEVAGIEVTDEARAEIDAFIQNQPQSKDGRVVYNLQEDFGVSADELRAPFLDYLAHHDVPSSTKL